MKPISGVIPAIPTIFKDNMEIDFDGIENCIEFAIKSGAGAIAPMLLGGEFYKLTFNEKIEIINNVSKFRKRIKIFAGVSEPATFAAKKLAEKAMDSGVSGIILMPPYYYPYGKLENSIIAKHFIDISNSIDIPVIIQDFGYRSNMPLKLLKTIAANNIAGIKTEGKDSARRIHLLHTNFPDISILGGYLGFDMVNELNNSSDGSITGLAFLDILSGVYEKYRNNDKTYIDDFSKIQELLGFEAENLKFFVQIEKKILYRRKIIIYTNVRSPEPEMPGRMDSKLNMILDKIWI